MITVFRKYGIVLLVLTVIMLITIAILKTDYVTVSGTVIERTTTSDRVGSIRHYVVIKSDDGFIEQKQGINFCQYKVGNRIRYKTVRTKDLF